MNSPRTSTANSIRPMLVPTITSALKKTELPLKIVINAKYTGAIIGHGGCNIREISKASRAKCMVDVNNPTRDVHGNQENVILITGNTENCSQACIKVMQVIHDELEKERGLGTHVELKIRVPNQLIGRLIGKGGATVKKVMEETGTSVSVSELRGGLESYSIYPDGMTFDRVITIRAPTIEAVANAEQKISHKLRSFYEHDLNTGASIPTGMNNNFGGGFVNVSPFFIGSPRGAQPHAPLQVAHDGASQIGAQPFFYSAPYVKPFPANDGGASANFCLPAGGLQFAHPMFCQAPFNGSSAYAQKMVSSPSNPIHLRMRIYVPSTCVGSLIGNKGSYIRTMMQYTGATIVIENPLKEQRKSSSDTKSDDLKKSGEHEDPTVNEENNAPTEAKNLANKSSNVDNNNKDVEVAKQEVPTDPVSTTSTSADGGAGGAESRASVTPRDASAQSQPSADNGNAVKASKKPPYNACGPNDRCVVVTGFDYQVLKAEFWIFQRIAESTMKYLEEIVLSAEVFVPSKIVGRIIGRSGQNVRELQRITQATVKVPDEIINNNNNYVGNWNSAGGSASHAANYHNELNSAGETAVSVTGTYFAIQAVQCRFILLICESEQRELNDQKRFRNFGYNGRGGHANSGGAHQSAHRKSATPPLPTTTATTTTANEAESACDAADSPSKNAENNNEKE